MFPLILYDIITIIYTVYNGEFIIKLLYKLTLINPLMSTVARARSVNSATATVAFRNGPRPRSVGVAASRSDGSTIDSAGELSSNGG